MAETVASLFIKARVLLNQYTEDGDLIPDEDVADNQAKFIPLADMAQKELWLIGRADTNNATPTALTTINDAMGLTDFASQAVVYYVAARLAPFSNKDLVNFFESKFLEVKEELKRTCASSIETITDYYASSDTETTDQDTF